MRLRKACELFSVSELGTPTRTPFYKNFLQDVLLELYWTHRREEEEEGEAKQCDQMERDLTLYHQLHGRQVRVAFTTEAEAMVLMVTRKHLVHKFGQQLLVVLPGNHAGTGSTAEGHHEDNLVPALPEIHEEDEEVTPDETILLQDVRYYNKLRTMLALHDELAETSSMIGGKFDVFECPHPDRKLSTTAETEESANKRFCMSNMRN